MPNRLLRSLPEILFALSVLAAAVLYGAYAQKHGLFPIRQVQEARAALDEVLHGAEKRDSLLYAPLAPDAPIIEAPLPDRLGPGLVLVMGVDGDRRNFVRVIDRAGAVIHEWRPDWFEIWGDSGRFPEDRRPISQPGALLHGVALLPSGDLVANFEYLSTFRLNPCGEVVWKLDNLGHHSVHVDADGAIWVAAEAYPEDPSARTVWTAQKLSPDGRILQVIDVAEVLRRNGLDGLLHLSAADSLETEVFGDALHLNDVETFPPGLPSAIFAPGDLMLSLRNINTVLVIDPATLRVKFRATGQFLRQHDPDFLPGDRISVFDNRDLPASAGEESASRVLEIDARTGAAEVVLDGVGPTRFFTSIMGVHQRLPNGDIFVTSSRQGRLLEVAPDGALAWSFRNRVGPERAGIVAMGMVLPPEMDASFFAARAAACR